MAVNLNLPSKLSLTGNLSVNWRKFRQSFEIYVAAAGLVKRNNDLKVATFLNLIGEEALEVYNNFEKDKDEEGNEAPETLASLLQKFEKYCNPKKNVLHARFVFYSRNQKTGESFDSFYTEIKTLAADCEFTDNNENIRDRLVFGSNDAATQKKLIIEGDTKLEKVIESLRVAEIVREQANQILDKSSSTVDAVKTSKERYVKRQQQSAVQNQRYQQPSTSQNQRYQQHSTVQNQQ